MPFVLEIGVRPELPRLFGDFGDHLLPLLPFGGRNPGEVNPPQVEAQRVQQFAEQNPAAAGVVVAGRVVAIARMAAGDQHGVGANLEGLDDQVEVDPPRARQADDAHVGRIFQAGRARQVGAQVGAPVAHVGDDLRLELGSVSLMPGSPTIA